MTRRLAAALLFLVAVPVATAQRVTRDQKVYLPRPESIAEHRAPSGTHADMGPREWVWNKAKTTTARRCSIRA